MYSNYFILHKVGLFKRVKITLNLTKLKIFEHCLKTLSQEISKLFH